MESRTMNGNSPCAARVPPTTGEGAAWAAERGWRLAIARAAAPTAANLLSAVRSFFKVLPSVGGWLGFGGDMSTHSAKECPCAGMVRSNLLLDYGNAPTPH